MKNADIEPAEDDAKLDKMDRKILNILQTDNQITNIALAEKVGLSPPPCLRRVKRLRDLGFITQDVSLIDPLKVGQRLLVFVEVSLEKQRDDLLAHFERKMKEQPEVMQCYFLSGDTDYLVVIQVSDVEEFNAFARRVFANEANMKRYRSRFCLNRVKYDTRIVLSED